MILKKAAWIVLAALLVMVANVVASILYMVVYGHLIDPGHEAKYYNDHIQLAGPYCSIVAGIPLMFLAGRLVVKWWDRKPGVMAIVYVWMVYAAIDLTLLLSVGVTSSVFVLFVISFVTKLAAGYFGARSRGPT